MATVTRNKNFLKIAITSSVIIGKKNVEVISIFRKKNLFLVMVVIFDSEPFQSSFV
jgi:uncharacterized protein YggU (UPF0235/DUF167 family)